MIRADVHQPYFRKFLWVFLGCTAFAAWCMYDGLVAYPRALTIAEAYEALPEDERSERWKKVASENGWPERTPSKSAEDIRHDIGSQFMMVVLCGILGVPALLMFMSGQGTWVEGDETLIRDSKGREVPIDSITKIDKRKWESKGIAKIHYGVNGKKRTFVMDDFKYDRATMGQLLRYAEADLTQDQIIGDFLEREKERPVSQSGIDQHEEDEVATDD